ncbi:hypothetical protein [Salinarimonas chemoclinalis]|uniref:hypothetical protein n=1 Tax=Salinarimonas chemoclinalis TaxID=3241599 RepID=UPI0035571D37
MRDEIDRLARLRDLRVTERQKDAVAAEGARDAARAELRRIQETIRAAQRERTALATLAPGEMVDAARIELRGRLDQALDGQIRAAARKQTIARRGLAEREDALAAAKQALRAAERARDQMETLGVRIAAEEARAAELAEELEADLPRPRRPGRGAGPGGDRGESGW